MLGVVVWRSLAVQAEQRVLSEKLDEALRNQAQQLEVQNQTMSRLAGHISKLGDMITDHGATFDSMREDILRLNDDVRGEVGTSKAIEMARKGASAEAIIKATKLSAGDVDAIVRFHGK
jgi:predicted RNase H-like nuclease (RuvC/YqgF family)